MAQDPLLVDQIQIEPGSAGLRLIRRATDGSLEFVDAVIPGGLTLKALAGLNITNFEVVSPTGAGADHSTIQAALDCIPATSGPTEPHVILIGPGVYQGTLNIVRDWVFLVGMGGVIIDPVEPVPNGPGAYHTAVIQAGLGTIPKHVVFQNVTIRNPHNNFACVRIVGGAASQVGETGIDFLDCKLQATATGGNRPIWATSMDYVRVQGGSFEGSHALSQVLAEECAGFLMSGVSGVTGVQLDYDTTATLPSVVGSLYRVSLCPDLGYGSTLAPQFQSTLSGAGELHILNCGRSKNVTVSGNRTFSIVGTDVSALVINNTTAGRLLGSGADSITLASGATLEQPVQQGTATFAAATTAAVVFTAKYPDTNYKVALELPSAPSSQDTLWITPKSASGFSINFAFNQTMVVGWTATRTM